MIVNFTGLRLPGREAGRKFGGRAEVAAAWLILLLAAPTPLFSQATAVNRPWSGQAQCNITVQGPGYSHQETHTWTLGSGSPTVQGAMHIFPATWSVSGKGSLERSQGSQTLTAQWTTNASMANAPVALFVRASDGKLILKSWHSQLRSRGGVNGTQTVTVNGAVQSQTPMSLEAFEWAFPGAEVASSSTSIQGSSTNATNGSVGPMQPGGSHGTAACTWSFSAGH